MSSRTRSLNPLSVASVLQAPLEIYGSNKEATHLKVSFRIFSRTSQGPLETYFKKRSADTSVTRRSIFHILGRRVGSWIHVSGYETLQGPLTIAEGIPSTRIRRRSFLRLSSGSADPLDRDAVFGWFSSLLKECAAAAAVDIV